MKNEPRSSRFVRHVSWSLLGQAGSFAINFFTIPILLREMGTQAYGLYVLIFAVSSYLLLMTLGSGAATIKFTAEFSGAGDRRRLVQALRYGAGYHGLGVGLAALVFIPAAPALAGALRLPEPAVFVLRSAAAGAVFAALFQFAVNAMQGLQRFGWANAFSLVLNAAIPLGAVAWFWAGWGLRAAAVWYAAANAVLAVAALCALYWLVKGVSSSGDAKPHSLREFSSYALGVAPGPAAGIVSSQFDKLFIANALPLSQLTLYSVPAGLLQRLQTLPATAASVLIPMLSEIRHDEDETALPRIYLKSTRILLWAFLPGIVLLFALFPQFLRLWLGMETGGRAFWSARLLVLAQAFYMVTHMPNVVTATRGRTWHGSAVSWSQAALSVLGWWLLIPSLGIVGAALSSCAAQFVSAFAYLQFVHHRTLKLGFGRYFEEALFVPMASCAVLLIAVFPLHGWASSWPRLIALCCGALLLYYGATWRWMNREDREFVRKLLRWGKYS